MKSITLASILMTIVLAGGCASVVPGAIYTKEQAVQATIPAGAVLTRYLSIPALIDGKVYKLEARLTYPEGADNSPIQRPAVVLTHGRNGPSPSRNRDTSKGLGNLTRALAEQGYPSIFVVRRGYGASEGPDSEFLSSPEASALAGAKDLAAAVEYMKTLSWVDNSKIVIMGQSQGGWVALGSSTCDTSGVIGAVNISGATNYQGQSNNRNDPATESRLQQSTVYFAKNQKVPTLWLYASNDNHSTHVVGDWFQTYKDAGGKGTLMFTPDYAGSSGNGHSVAGAPNYYFNDLLQWLRQIGFAPTPRTAQ